MLGACTDLETDSPLDSGTHSGASGDGGLREPVTGGAGGETGGSGGTSSGAGGELGGSGGGSGGSGGSGGMDASNGGTDASAGQGGDAGSGGTPPDDRCSPDAGDAAPGSCDESCEADACVPTCSEDQRPCGGECLSNTMACAGQCPDGSHDCAGVCVPDTSTDGCGESSCTPCTAPMFGSPTCDGTSCDFECDATYRKCDDSCVPAGGCCEDDECSNGFACVMGMCKSFCAQSMRPSGVAASDYRCLDFDTSTALPWPIDVYSGAAMHTTSAVFSLPGSFVSSYMPAASGTPRAQMSWEASGGLDIKAMHVSVRIRPQLPPPVQPPYEGGMEAMCIDSPGFKQCLMYTNRGTLYPLSGPEITSYTGWFVHTEISSGAFLTVDCPLTRQLTMDAWNLVEYDASPEASIRVNGMDAGDCAGAARGTASGLTLGVADRGGASHWNVVYDNVVVSVYR